MVSLSPVHLHNSNSMYTITIDMHMQVEDFKCRVKGELAPLSDIQKLHNEEEIRKVKCCIKIVC